MMIRNLSFLAVLTLQAFCELALAEPRMVEEEVTLRYSKQATAEQIYLLIGIKANQVCDSRAIYPHLNLSGEAQCRKQFIHDAVSAIDRPKLTALHRESIGIDAITLAAGDR